MMLEGGTMDIQLSKGVHFILLAAVALGGCEAAQVQEPLTNSVGGSAPGEQLEFWFKLSERPVTSNDDAMHGLLLFVDGKDGNTDYAGRVADLKQRGLLPGGFDEPGNQAVTRGTLAVALAKTLEIRGGVVMRLMPMSGRYATKELVYMDLYPPSSPHQTFSGTEFLGILSKAEEYQQMRRGDFAPAPPELPPEEPEPAAPQPPATAPTGPE